MEHEWALLRNCADFKDVYDYVFNKYGVEDYLSVLDTIEAELEEYENSSEDEWQEIVDAGNVKDSVWWYVGTISTEYFLNECFFYDKEENKP